MAKKIENPNVLKWEPEYGRALFAIAKNMSFRYSQFTVP
jgi:hypothetical protein